MSSLPIDNNIRRLRFEHGEMTQQALAEQVGVTRQTINAIDLRTLDRHPDAAVTSLIPALSCRSCRPDAPFAEGTSSPADMAKAKPADMTMFISACGKPGDTGNSIGVGKFCMSISDCTGNGMKTQDPLVGKLPTPALIGPRLGDFDDLQATWT